MLCLYDMNNHIVIITIYSGTLPVKLLLHTNYELPVCSIWHYFSFPPLTATRDSKSEWSCWTTAVGFCWKSSSNVHTMYCIINYDIIFTHFFVCKLREILQSHIGTLSNFISCKRNIENYREKNQACTFCTC